MIKNNLNKNSKNIKKNKLLCPDLFTYMHCFDDISDDEINIAINLLDSTEKLRLLQYESAIGTNATRKRLFIFICSLIDFKELTNYRLNTGKI